MNAIKSILVVVDRSPTAADAVSKAVSLARRFGARIELYTCDAERSYTMSQAYLPTGVEEARRACVADGRQYLEELKRSAAAPDVAITLDAACESPLYESVVRKVVRERPDLVIKNATRAVGQWSVRFDATDWQLMRACPATLMLTRGMPWRTPSRFAAAVDASDSETTGLAQEILHSAHVLAKAVGGQLDVVYAAPSALGEDPPGSGIAPRVHELVGKLQDTALGVEILSGRPEDRLPSFAAHRGYDVIVMGALAHRLGPTAQVGTLTAKLADALDCDFILVKPHDYRCPVPGSAGRANLITQHVS